MAGMPIRKKRKDNVAVLKETGMLVQAMESLIESVAEGMTLQRACQNAELHYPWVAVELFDNEALAAKFDAARRARAAKLAEETIEIADDLSGESNQEAKKAELQIRARQWLAAKEHPERWGDKVRVESVNINLVQIIEEARARIADGDVIDGTSERV